MARPPPSCCGGRRRAGSGRPTARHPWRPPSLGPVMGASPASTGRRIAALLCLLLPLAGLRGDEPGDGCSTASSSRSASVRSRAPPPQAAPAPKPAPAPAVVAMEPLPGPGTGSRQPCRRQPGRRQPPARGAAGGPGSPAAADRPAASLADPLLVGTDDHGAGPHRPAIAARRRPARRLGTDGPGRSRPAGRPATGRAPLGQQAVQADRGRA